MPVRAARPAGSPDILGYADDDDPYAMVAEAVTAHSHARGRIGVDFASYAFTADAHRRLRALLPEAELVDLGPVSDTLRACKFPDEIELITRAAGIADETMRLLAEGVRPGMRVREAAAIAAAAMLRLGADEGGPGPVVRAAGAMEFLHGSGLDAVLASRDVLHVELTPRVRHYGARLMRPLILDPSPAQLERAARIVALQDRQIAAMQPGAEASAVDRVLRAAVLAEGLRADYPNVTGYTLGLYGRTPRPSDFSFAFHPGAAFVLQPGMIFHMYASAQGMAFSETVLVAEYGPCRLTQAPRAAIPVPASATAGGAAQPA
jgi:Xaa-Pro aminopeptidase